MKKSVGLLLMTKIGEEYYAILQRRGEFNHEKMGLESWAGGCQVTVHGKVRGDETLEDAIWRETEEELGREARHRIRSTIQASGGMRLLCDNVADEKETHTYGAVVPADILKHIRLNASTGGLRLLPREEIDMIFDLTSTSHSEQKIFGDFTAMFPDERDAVEMAFTMVDTGVLR